MNIKELAVELWRSGDFESRADVAKHINDEYGLFHYSNYNSLRRTVTRYISQSEIDHEILTENVRLAKQRQSHQDRNRIERKSFREYARIENAVLEYSKAISDQLARHGAKLPKKLNLKPLGVVNGGVGIIQITDTHFNELIDLDHNKYDFRIASQRLKKLITESIGYFEYRGVERVLMAFTGDLLNSDRRLDELLSQSVNRSKASLLSTHIILQSILEVAHYYPVDIISVMGNESRTKKEMAFSNDVISDNYDFTIMAMCKKIVEVAGYKNITFGSIDTMEAVVNFGEQKWLFMHDVPKVTTRQNNTQSTIGRYFLADSPIDFVVGGHVHAHRGTDISCRAGSMAGSNAYNEHALNLHGRASSVCYVVKGKDRFYQYIDLQNADNEGYEIETELEAYNAKSVSKTREGTRILEIVI